MTRLGRFLSVKTQLDREIMNRVDDKLNHDKRDESAMKLSMGTKNVRDEFFTTNQVAALLQVTVRCLAYWRSYEKGPPFVRLGSKIRYRASDLLQWFEQQTVRSAKGGQ